MELRKGWLVTMVDMEEVGELCEQRLALTWSI